MDIQRAFLRPCVGYQRCNQSASGCRLSRIGPRIGAAGIRGKEPGNPTLPDPAHCEVTEPLEKVELRHKPQVCSQEEKKKNPSSGSPRKAAAPAVLTDLKEKKSDKSPPKHHQTYL